jgi:hypothetical protein
LSAYQAAAAADVRLSALPNPGPLGEGEPGPLAAGSPEPVMPVLGDAPTPPAPEVDALAMASEVGAGAASPESVNGGLLSTAAPAAAPTAPPSEDLGAGLTVEPVLASGVPLASSASGAASAAMADPVLEPDGGVDLLALAAIEVPLP